MAKLKPNHPDSYREYSGNLIKEIPILFQTEMVQANLADMKTQTRRIIRDLDPDSILLPYKMVGPTFLEPSEFDKPENLQMASCYPNTPYGKPGDLLWVRETHANLNNGLANSEPFFVYKADLEHPDQHGPVTWKPSIHMPKSASRLWLMVEEIRVERLQDITEEDAKAEGCIQYEKDTDWMTAKYGYQILWESINGKESWNSNPWVWVIKYRILSKTGRPSDEVILKNHLEITKKEVSNG